MAKIESGRTKAPYGRSSSREVPLKDRPPGPDAQIAPNPLPMQIADYLRDLIVHDHLHPGERIREQYVADQLQVSRTPTREALMILAMEGLVNIDPNRGAQVALYDDAALADVRKIQAALEGLACVIIAQRRKDVDLRGVLQQFSRMKKALPRQEKMAFFDAVKGFYHAIVSATGKRTLIDLHWKISTILHRSQYLQCMSNEISETLLAQHKVIMEALERNEPALARSLILKQRSGAA